MKIVKPLSLGILYKPYRYRQGHHFVVTALGFFRLGENVARFLPEPPQWPIVMQALPPGEPLDYAMPKGRGEVLLAATAYAPSNKPATRMSVRVTVGAIDKQLNILGDREWLYGLVPLHQITEPAPFSSIPIRYDRAYGGPDYPANPIGQAHTGQRVPAFVGVNRGRMPNIELPQEPVRSHRAKYAPAGFGALDIRSPARQKKAGTYGREWMENDFPGLANDVDWTVFNAAPEDQQIDGFFTGGESYRLAGLHPDKPVIEGRLPTMRVSALVQHRGKSIPESDALSLAFETVWFFPDQNLGVALYRGQTSIDDSDALDVEAVLIGYEHSADAARSTAHYHTTMRQRLDPATAALHALNDAPLTPEVTPAARAASQEQRRQAEAKALAQRQALLDETTAEYWAKSGRTPPKDYVPPKVDASPLPSISPESIANGDVDLAEFVASATALAQAARQEGETRLKELEQKKAALAKPVPANNAVLIEQAHTRAANVAYDLVDDPVAREAAVAPLLTQLDQARAAGARVTDEERARVRDAALQMSALQRKARRVSTTPLAPATPLPYETATALGKRIREWHAAGQCLAGRDFAGAQLRGINFAGADLRETLFENADLSDADFRGANLHGAVFTHACIERADFSGAELTQTNFSGACGNDAIFRGAQLNSVLAIGVQCARADFSGACLRSIVALQALLTDAKLDETDLSQAMLVNAIANGARFSRARLERTVLLGADLRNADFTEATIERSVFLDARAERSRWRGAKLNRMVAGGKASFAEADMQDMRAEQCGWRDADMRGVDFSRSKLMSCDFGRCRLDNARFRETFLWRSIFMQASLIGVDAERADFFEAICRKTDFRGSRLHGANLVRAEMSEARFDNSPSNNGLGVKP